VLTILDGDEHLRRRLLDAAARLDDIETGQPKA
jgi:hypothetical protein